MAALQHLTQRWQGAYFSRLVDRLARSARASGQPLHFVFRTSPSLALKTRDVGSVSVSTIGNVPVCTIDVNFLGLQGVCSPLPTHYTESILFAESPAVLDAFYNYFNQRIIEFSLKVRYSNDMLYPSRRSLCCHICVMCWAKGRLNLGCAPWWPSTLRYPKPS
jgi:predicted component of type VI protein secretion system